VTRDSNMRSGGQVLVDQLRIHGADLAFGMPGESYLAVLDAFYDAHDLRFLVCRQEGGAAMMAEAYGKLTGRPGICFATRGPGATNASAGVHIAQQDSTPMILFIGQIARDTVEREAFQEIDYRRMFGSLCKWVAQIDDAERIPELVSRAFYTATAGRPGPVVLALPEDMLTDQTAVDDAAAYTPVRPHPSPRDMTRLRALLAEAKRPFVIVGGGGWSAEAGAHMQGFAEAFDLPVGNSFRCRDYVDNDHSNYVGDVGIAITPKLAQRVKEADLLLVVGARLGEITTSGYRLLQVPRPAQTLVHVHAGAEELGRVYQPTLAINAASPAFAEAARMLEPPGATPWASWTAALRAEYLEASRAPTIPGRLQMGEVMTWLQETLPPEAILTNGAGNYSAWPNLYYAYRRYGTQLGPTSGSMGYGLPAAVAAKAAYPERPVVCFAGDGCFLMTGQELATAVQYDLPIVIIVINNGMLGTIRMHQERKYPERVVATELRNPDFAAYARAFGAHGEVVERTEDFAPAFQRALASGKPALLDLHVDPEALTPRASLSAIRKASLAPAKV
jgi:acetolactate synthase-1/2/3 large subunit